MATYKNVITPYKLTKGHKVALKQFLSGKVGLTKTHERMGITKQRLYTMVTHMTKHSCTTGRINIKEILKDY